MKFEYFAFGEGGKISKGDIEAASRADALAKLKASGLTVINLRLSSVELNLRQQRPRRPSLAPLANWWEKFKAFEASFGKVKTEDKIVFVSNLNLMLKSGVGLAEAIATIRNQVSSKFFQGILNHVLMRVRNGVAFSTALSYYDRIFPPLFVNIIRIGEESGNLEENLLYLSEELDKKISMRKKIKSAMMYPAVILFAATVVVGVVVYYILPQLATLFSSMDVELPWTTQLLVNIAHLIENHGILIIISFIGAGFLVRYLATKGPLKYFYHRFLVKGPIIGKINRQIILVNISRTLFTLLKSGIPIIRAIRDTHQITTNIVYRQKLKTIINSVNKGEPIYKALKVISIRDPKLFPPMVVTTLEIGEKTGRLEEVLEHLAKFYEREVDSTLKNLSTLFEPLLLLFMGIAVAFVAVSIIMPLYSMTSAI
jgi:type IV pilus assembly protein PilC